MRISWFRMLSSIIATSLVLGLPVPANAADPTPVSTVTLDVGVGMPSAVVVGASHTLAIDVTAHGADLADATVSIPIATALTPSGPVTISGPAGPSCAITPGMVTCDDVDLAVENLRRIELTITAAATGIWPIRASVTSATGLVVPKGRDRYATPEHEVTAYAAGTTDIALGGAYLWGSGYVELSIHNRGPVDTDVTVTGTLAGGSTATFTSGGAGCVAAGTNLTCTLNLPAGTSVNTAIVIGGPAGAAIDVTFSATNGSGLTDVRAGNNTRHASGTLSTGSSAISTFGRLTGTELEGWLEIAKPVGAVAGLTATISIPGGTFVAAYPDPLDDCTGIGTATLVCDISAHPSNYISGGFFATVPPGTTQKTITSSLAASVVLTGTTSDVVAVDQRIKGDLALRAHLESTVANVDGTNPGTAVATIGAFNAGSSPATSASVALPLPTGVTPDVGSLPGGCSWAPPTVTCALGDVQAYEYATHDIPLIVAGNLVGYRRLTATITAASGLGASADDQRTRSLAIHSQQVRDIETGMYLTLPNLPGNSTVSLTDRTLNVGDRTLVRASIWRYYPGADRPGLDPTVATFVLPPFLAFVAGEVDDDSLRPCTALGQVVTCTIGTLTGSTRRDRTYESASIDLIVEASGGTGTGSIQGYVDDERLATDNHVATQTLLVTVEDTLVGGDLSVVPHSVRAQAGYPTPTRVDIPVRNLSAFAATGAVATISIPSGTTIDSASATQGSCAVTATVTCSLGTIPAGHHARVILTMSAADPITTSFVTEVTTTSTDPVESNDRARSTLSWKSDYTVGVWAGATVRTTVGATATLPFSVQYYAPGAVQPTSRSIYVQLPPTVVLAGTDNGSCQMVEPRLARCDFSGAQVYDGGGGLQSITANLQFEGYGVGDMSGAIWPVGDAVVTSDHSNGFGTFRTIVGPAQRDLVTAVVPPTRATAVGDRAAVRVSVRNSGGTNATGVVVAIALPAGVDHVASGGPVELCSPSGTPVVLTCLFGTIAPGEYASADVVVEPTARPAGAIVATATADGVDGNPSTDAAQALLPVRVPSGGGPDLAVEIGSHCTAQVGERCIATALVRNDGGVASTSSSLAITPPSGASIVEWRVAESGCSIAGTQLLCSLGGIDPGEVRDVRVAMQVTARGRTEATISATATAPADADTANDETAWEIRGIEHAVAAAPTSVAFTDTGIGGSRGTVVAVTNDDAATHRLRAKVVGADAGRFAVSTRCDRVLQSGDGCSMQVTFAPAQARAHSAEVRLYGAGGRVVGSIPLTGAGIAAVASHSGSLPAGGTISTDPLGGGVSALMPVAASLIAPVAGTVTLGAPGTPTTSAPSGYSLLGQELQISAPDAVSASDPLRLTFTIDASAITSGIDPSTVTVLRNGVPVTAACSGDTAVPTPCLRSRTTLAGGDVQLVVLTMQASSWVFARTVSAGGGTGTGTGTGTGGGGGTGGDDGSGGNEDPTPTVEPTPTRLTGATVRIQRYRCTRREQRLGVRQGRRVWCHRIVASAKLVRTTNGSPVSGQRVNVYRVVGRRQLLVRQVRTNGRGQLTLRRSIVIPAKHRRNLKLANRWLASQYGRARLRHLASGNNRAAPVLTVRVRR